MEELFSLPPKGRCTTLHNSSFSDVFFHQLTFALLTGIVCDPDEMSKADLRVTLLRPLLQNIAHCASHMAYMPEEPRVTDDADAIDYASSFSVEVNTEVRKGRQGQKPMWTI